MDVYYWVGPDLNHGVLVKTYDEALLTVRENEKIFANAPMTEDAPEVWIEL